jgi:hypothetical protein
VAAGPGRPGDGSDPRQRAGHVVNRSPMSPGGGSSSARHLLVIGRVRSRVKYQNTTLLFTLAPGEYQGCARRVVPGGSASPAWRETDGDSIGETRRMPSRSARFGPTLG